MSNAIQQLSESSQSTAEVEVLPTFPGDLFVKNVHKSFGVTKALDGVSFTGYFGEIHAVIGGNGCGKSTLAKVLAGVLPIDSGKVSVKGHHPNTPGESRAIGVTMVFQEVLVADEASVVDNLFIGSDSFFSKSMSDKDKEQKARIMMSELAGESVDPLMPAGTLPLSIKAWITIARGLLTEPDVLILDESSAALDFDSTERLFNKMRELRDRGSAIIIVTHRIAELIRISDRCTVMRDGVDVGVLEKTEITEENLLRLMTGKSQTEKPKIGDAHISASREVVVKTKDMLVWPDGERVDFNLMKGEIIGITGLDGHGQDDFVRIVAGVKPASEGFAEVKKKEEEGYFTIKSLEDAKAHEIAFVSGDRKKEGILPNLSIFENLLFPLYRSYTKLPGLRIIDWLGLRDMFDWEVERLDIKTGPEDNLITSLSGGNQQKVMLGRAFATHPSTLVLLDPARGIDLHTKRDLYKQLREFASEGGSVIYMSSELEEFIGFCSRVLVFRNGSVFEEFFSEKIEPVGILESMFGRSQGNQGHDAGPKIKVQPNSAQFKVQQDESQIDNITLAHQTTQNNQENSKTLFNSVKTQESGVNKYNVSKNIRQDSKKSDEFHEYTSSDEAQFQKLMSGSQVEEDVLGLRRLVEPEPDLKAQNTPTHYTDSDTQNFEKLMNQNDKFSRNYTNSGYTDSDAKNFEALMQSGEKDQVEKDLALFSQDKYMQDNKSLISETDTASSGSISQSREEAAYTEQDLQKFSKLMS